MPSHYEVQAHNAATTSENRIHDDAVARRYGFRGGLVPGADVYAYMTHLAVRRWGAAWLAQGAGACRFVKPVYDGRVATITGTENGDTLQIEVESDGELCAVGSATLPAAAAAAPEPVAAEPVPAAALRPAADETSLAVGRRLSTAPLRLTAEFLERYLDEVRETEPLYRRERVAHPGLLLRLANSALKDNVVLGPWIHTGSTIRHYAAARLEDEIAVRAAVTANYERKGHRFVELDAAVVLNGTRVAAQVGHTAIYRLRQAAVA